MIYYYLLHEFDEHIRPPLVVLDQVQILKVQDQVPLLRPVHSPFVTVHYETVLQISFINYLK